MHNSEPDVTRFLLAWNANDAAALQRLMTAVYGELRKIARRHMAGERAGHTLQPSALINEAYIRLAKWKEPQWRNRNQFFAICSRLMRQILVDHARSKASLKRGAAGDNVTLDTWMLATASRSMDVIALDASLERLTALDARKGRVVELRIFGGLTAEETAEVLQLGVNTVHRDWKFSISWLRRELETI